MQSLQFPYWVKERVFPYRFELNYPRNLVGWKHPDQERPGAIRPNGHQVLAALEGDGLLDRAIGLKSISLYQASRQILPDEFQEVYIFGWIDTVFGPYADHRFVPALTPSNGIKWVDLETGFDYLDMTPLTTA